MRTPGSIKPLMFFRPFPVINKTKITDASSTGPPVWRITFGLPEEQTLGINLGLGEHVKVRLREDCVDNVKGGKPRSYSPTSAPARKGSFDLTVKEYSDGCASKYLGSLSVGDSVHMSRGWPLPANWMMQRSGGRRVGLIALGVGITEAVWVADAELRRAGNTSVKLLYANRYFADRVMLEDIKRLEREFHDRFSVQYLTSRENHPEAMNGRVSSQVLAECFDWNDELKEDSRFLVVGTKPMKKDVYAMIEANGFPAQKHTLLLKQFRSRTDRISKQDGSL